MQRLPEMSLIGDVLKAARFRGPRFWRVRGLSMKLFVKPSKPAEQVKPPKTRFAHVPSDSNVRVPSTREPVRSLRLAIRESLQSPPK